MLNRPQPWNLAAGDATLTIMRTVRLITAALALAGILLTAAGPAKLLGLLPYFTIQSSLLYGGYVAWISRRAGTETDPVRKGAVTLYVAITGLVYHLVLDNPHSGFAAPAVDRSLTDAIGNQLLHTVVPLLAVLDWLVFDARGRFRWRYAGYWLAYPLAYLAFALVRGAIVGEYPYPFLDVDELGYRGVTITALVFAVAFWLLGLLFVLIDRLPRPLPRRLRSGAGEKSRDRRTTIDE